MHKDRKPLVGIIMGSDSDLPILMQAAEICMEFDIPYEMRVISAHRTPDDCANYAKDAHKRGLKVIIAGAGGAAHLAGVIAAHTPLPVLGVPIQSKTLNGVDSLYSIVQMPPGVPVGTLGIGGGKNAGLLAMQILGIHFPEIQENMLKYKYILAEESRLKNEQNEAFTDIYIP